MVPLIYRRRLLRLQLMVGCTKATGSSERLERLRDIQVAHVHDRRLANCGQQRGHSAIIVSGSLSGRRGVVPAALQVESVSRRDRIAVVIPELDAPVIGSPGWSRRKTIMTVVFGASGWSRSASGKSATHRRA